MISTSALRDRVEELEEENRQLRAELVGSAPPIEGLTPTENLIVQLLKTGRVVNVENVNLARVGSRFEPMSDNTFKVFILRLRHKTGLPIKNIWGRGYKLSSDLRV